MSQRKFYPDWLCPCGEECFGSRDKCRKCGGFRSRGCQLACGEINAAYRETCDCGGLKSNRIKKNTLRRKPGDWTCKCGELNFSSRSKCRKCGSDKDKDVTTPTNNVCSICAQMWSSSYVPSMFVSSEYMPYLQESLRRIGSKKIYLA